MSTFKENTFTSVTYHTSYNEEQCQSYGPQWKKAFQYLQQKFPEINESKVKEGIFIGPQIRNLRKDKNFDALLKGTKKVAWEVLKLVDNFLGKHKAPTYRTHVDTLRGTFRNMGCNISLKLHFHHSHLDTSSKQLRRGQFSIFM